MSPVPSCWPRCGNGSCAATDGRALTSAIQVKRAEVLHGMGGVGKSVLARALCDDPAVQAAFPDGILWATLGQTPDLTARLHEWIDELRGTVDQMAPTPNQLSDALAERAEGQGLPADRGRRMAEGAH